MWRSATFILNRSGNRPSHEGAPEYFDAAIALCREAGFREVLLRGDTDFSLTKNFDRWDADEVKFVFGFDAKKNMIARAEEVEEYWELERRAARVLKTQLCGGPQSLDQKRAWLRWNLPRERNRRRSGFLRRRPKGASGRGVWGETENL